jgi:hypothetical protein
VAAVGWRSHRVATAGAPAPGSSGGGSYTPVPPAPPWAAQPRTGHQPAAQRSPAGWRRPLSIALIVAGCIAAPLALAGFYVHTDLMDVDGYVRTITPVAGEPAVQDAIADVLAAQISKALDAAGSSVSPLPEELGSVAGQLGDVLPIDSLTRKMTKQALASDAFAGFWAAANRRIHPLLVAAIESKSGHGKQSSPVGLDLSAVTAAVTDLLAAAGVSLPDPLPEALATGKVPMLDSLPLAQAGRVILALDRSYLALILVAVAALAAGLAAARDRLRAGIYVGGGLALAMAGLQVGLWATRARYLDVAARSHIPRAASAAVFDVMTTSLRAWAWSVLIAGVATALACLLVAAVVRRST